MSLLRQVLRAADWSRDGRFVICRERPEYGRRLVDLTGSTHGRSSPAKPRPSSLSPSIRRRPASLPTLAGLTVDKSGQFEVYFVPFPTRAKVHISTSGVPIRMGIGGRVVLSMP